MSDIRSSLKRRRGVNRITLHVVLLDESLCDPPLSRHVAPCSLETGGSVLELSWIRHSYVDHFTLDGALDDRLFVRLTSPRAARTHHSV